MMTQGVTFPVYSNDIFNSIELGYGQGNYVMTILLPNDGKKTSDVIGCLTSDIWNKMNENLSSELVELKMPRFNMSFETSLNDILSAMGMADVFNPKDANFHGISSNGGLYISELKHKTKVNVDEEGTVAVASTRITVSVLSNETPKVIKMNINKPFVFVISEKSTGAILFTGRIMDPTK